MLTHNKKTFQFLKVMLKLWICILFVIVPVSFSWDVTDYSSFSSAYKFLEEYPQHTKNSDFPEFSWARVPRWLALRSTKAMSDAAIETVAKQYQLVMLEKANGQGMPSIEEGIESVTKRLKAVNPDIKTLFYWNSYIQYGGYAADTMFDANEWDWSKKVDSNGVEKIFMFKDKYNLFNYDNEDLREWWINVPVTMAQRGIVDGVFIDKCGGFASRPTFNSQGVPLDNYKQMVYDLSQRMPEEKVLVGNILRNEWDNAGRAPMEYFDGSYLERWAFRNRNVSNTQPPADAITVTIQLMREALLKGKMINFQTSMEYTDIPADDPDWEARAQDAVSFPLAIFLIIAEENAYFSYQHGVNALNDNHQGVIWETSFIEEFHKPLGEPLGPPTKNGYDYSRSYKYLDVSVNIETEETSFIWKDSTTDIGPPKEHCNGNAVRFNVGKRNVSFSFNASKDLWVKNIDVIALNGRKAMSSEIAKTMGKQTKLLKVQRLSPGYYLVNVTFNTNSVQTHKIILVR